MNNTTRPWRYWVVAKKKKGLVPRRNPSLVSTLHLCRLTGVYRTDSSTGTAVNAFFRINNIDVTFSDGICRTLRLTSATSNTILVDYICH